MSPPEYSCHEALIYVLPYVSQMELLLLEGVCKALKDEISRDHSLWRHLEVFPPYSTRLNGKSFGTLVRRSQGQLESVKLHLCTNLQGEDLIIALSDCFRLEKVLLRSCYINQSHILELLRRLGTNCSSRPALRVVRLYEADIEPIFEFHPCNLDCYWTCETRDEGDLREVLTELTKNAKSTNVHSKAIALPASNRAQGSDVQSPISSARTRLYVRSWQVTDPPFSSFDLENEVPFEWDNCPRCPVICPKNSSHRRRLQYVFDCPRSECQLQEEVQRTFAVESSPCSQYLLIRPYRQRCGT